MEPYEKENALLGTTVVGLGSGLAASFASTPWDVVKTNVQQTIRGNRGARAIFKEVFEMHGARGLLVGLPAKTFLTVISYAFNGMFLSKVKELRSKPELISNAEIFPEKMQSPSVTPSLNSVAQGSMTDDRPKAQFANLSNFAARFVKP